MAYYGDPLGINWFPMLALYSSLGKSSNSYEEKCQIGTQLQKLEGKDRLVIEGINNKIDQLISRNNVSLSGKEMISLKDSIVKELGNIVSQYGNQSSGPVVCDANSLVFDEDVKSLLSDLVREKAENFTQSHGKSMGNNSNQEISQMIYMSSITPDYFKGNLYNKEFSQIVSMFMENDPKLTIGSDNYLLDGEDNSNFVIKNPLFTWDRSILENGLLELSKKRYKRNIPKTTLSEIKSVFYLTKTDDVGNKVYVLNDVELLRVVHTIIEHDEKSIR